VTAPPVVDARTAPALAARVRAAASTHRRVTVDLRHVEAVDAAGLRSLRLLAERLPVVLRRPPPATRARLALTGLGTQISAYR
jgi:anti-anti-sigma regulatory factor